MKLLYSTNTNLKFVLQRDYFGGLHYAWCSPTFDYRAVGKYGAGSSMPPSSDPASIYRDLHEATRRPDAHSSKINEQKATLKALAVRFATEGRLSDAYKDEVIQVVDTAPITEWRPLLFVIPCTDAIMKRVKEVPLARRASREREFIIEDLTLDEFDVIEFPA